MALKRRLRDLETKAQDEITFLIDTETGEELMVAGDADMRLLVAGWQMGRGEEYDAALVERLGPYLKRGSLVRKHTGEPFPCWLEEKAASDG